MDNIKKYKKSSHLIHLQNYFKYLNEVLNSINKNDINALAEFLDKCRIRRGTTSIVMAAPKQLLLCHDLGFDI